MLMTFDKGAPRATAALNARNVAEDDTLQVLILDDERFDRHRMARLCSGMDTPIKVSNASTLDDFEGMLVDQDFDLILVDYKLPDGTGMDALALVRMSPRNLNAATIMVTGQGQESLAQQAISGGCADYLTKDELTPAAFRRAVTNALEKSRLTTQVAAQSYARAEVEAVLEHFASSFARDIKPMVSRMLRQLRAIRSAEKSAAFEALDETCLSMWEALVTLERNTGPEIMALALPEASAFSKGMAEAGEESSPKPPSPFSRTRH